MKNLILITLIYSCITTAFANNIEAIRNTKRVSVVYVGTTDDISASSFGHIALRMSPSLKPTFGDSVVEFVADVPDDENPFKKYTKGIGLPYYSYPVVSVISPFYDFKKINQIGQDRDVEIFEIDMTQDQIDKLVDSIINYKTQLSAEDYTFFSKNCSYFSLVFLEEALGREIDKKSYPWKVKKILEKMNIVKQKISYPRGSAERKRVAISAFEKHKINESFKDPKWEESFLRMIEKNDYHNKMSAYLKLLAVYSDNDTSVQIKKKIKRLIRLLKSYESSAIKFVIKEFFKNADQKLVIPLTAQSYRVSANPDNKRAFKHKLLVDNDKVYIEVKIVKRKSASPKSSNRTQRETKRFEITDFKFNPTTKAITYNGQHIGRHIKSKKLDFILTQRFDYGIDINEKSKTISPIIYIDPTKGITTPNISYKKLKESGVISLNNVRDFKGTGGTCKALALLQKALTERVIFLEDGEYGTKVDKIELLDSVYDGNFAVVSGYKGIYDFTASIDQETLKQYIINLQKNKINKSAQDQVIENVKHQTEIDEDSFLSFQGMLKEGILIYLDVGKFYRDSNLWAKNVGHSLLIYDIEPNGDGRYKLTAYDPNTGLNKLFKVNNDFKLEHVLYPKEFDYRAAIPKITRNQIEMDNAVRSRGINYQSLKFSQQAGEGTLIIPRNKIHMLLK
jgi:hypothetical protein